MRRDILTPLTRWTDDIPNSPRGGTMVWRKADVMKERVKFLLERERQLQEGQGQVVMVALCRAYGAVYPPFAECTAPNMTWCLAFKGHFRTKNGARIGSGSFRNASSRENRNGTGVTSACTVQTGYISDTFRP